MANQVSNGFPHPVLGQVIQHAYQNHVSRVTIHYI